jgi:hypothetical protein
VQVGRAGPIDVYQAAEVLARLAISLFPAREGTVTLDDDETIVALAHKVLLPMLEPRPGRNSASRLSHWCASPLAE